jgi:hypothetical protein
MTEAPKTANLIWKNENNPDQKSVGIKMVQAA